MAADDTSTFNLDNLSLSHGDFDSRIDKLFNLSAALRRAGAGDDDANCTKRLSDLEAQLVQVEDDYAALSANLEVKATLLAESEETQNAIRKENAELKLTVEQLRANLAEIKLELADRAALLERSEEKLNVAVQRAALLSGHVETMRAERDSLIEEAKRSGELYDEAVEETRRLRDKYRRRKEALAKRVAGQIDSTQRTLREAQDKFEDVLNAATSAGGASGDSLPPASTNGVVDERSERTSDTGNAKTTNAS